MTNETTPAPQSGKELYEERKHAELKQTQVKHINTGIKQWGKIVVGVAVAALAIVGGYQLFLRSPLGEFSVTSTCITGETYHVHSTLRIIINGEEQKIPSNLGTAPCVKPIHTHDDTGLIHLENAKPFRAILGDFFLVWEKPFSRDHILDYNADETHEIIMTVTGERSDQYENLVLEDKQEIVIEYKTKE